MADIRYKASDNYILREIAGEKVLVAVGAGVADFRGYIKMNESAAEIWKVLQNEVDEQTIVDALAAEYDASETDIKKDVHEILNMLIARKMVMKYDA